MTERLLTEASGPRLDRPLTLRFMGDWGQANIHRICGWLAQEVWDRSVLGTRCSIWNGRGGTDAARALESGSVDVAVATPAAFAGMALEGRGPFEGRPMQWLRALGTVPQRDRLVLAVAGEVGVESFADLRRRKPPIRVATSPDDGVNHVGLAGQAAMSSHGITRAELEGWGGSYLEYERPFPCLDRLISGEVDAILHEAIMSPGWQAAGQARDLRYIPFEDGALSSMQDRFGWPRASVPAGYLPGLADDLLTLDFSDFVLMVREDLPEEVAHLLAWCMGETSNALEVQYRHLPPDRSPVTYPLSRKEMGRSPIPLHPGAARYYDALA